VLVPATLTVDASSPPSSVSANTAALTIGWRSTKRFAPRSASADVPRGDRVPRRADHIERKHRHEPSLRAKADIVSRGKVSILPRRLQRNAAANATAVVMPTIMPLASRAAAAQNLESTKLGERLASLFAAGEAGVQLQGAREGPLRSIRVPHLILSHAEMELNLGVVGALRSALGQ
jgi:hypothetical protein